MGNTLCSLIIIFILYIVQLRINGSYYNAKRKLLYVTNFIFLMAVYSANMISIKGLHQSKE